MTIRKLLDSRTAPRISQRGVWFNLFGPDGQGGEAKLAGGDFHFICRVARQKGILK